MKHRVIVFEQDNKKVIQEGNHFFTSITEEGETFESGDFNSFDRAKASLGLVPTTEETNNSLAKFMEWEFNKEAQVFKVPFTTKLFDTSDHKDWCASFHEENSYSGYLLNDCELLFDNDWNWLMLVVEKIESLGYKVNNFSINNYIYIGKDDVVSVIINEPNLTKKEAFYQAVVEFVNWYNENK